MEKLIVKSLRKQTVLGSVKNYYSTQTVKRTKYRPYFSAISRMAAPAGNRYNMSYIRPNKEAIWNSFAAKSICLKK